MGIANLINGRRYSYSSLEITVAALSSKPKLYIDIQSIEYSEKLDFGFIYGTSRGPIGSTAGRYTPSECSMEMGTSTAAQLITQLGPGWLGLNLIIAVAYADIGEPLTVDTIPARFTGRSLSHSSGSDALMTSLTFTPIDSILTNGVPSLLNRVF